MADTPSPATRLAPRAASAPVVLGWRERLALPALGIARIRAKLDTGARTSALHVDAIETFVRDGETWLRFTVTTGTRVRKSWRCEARASDRRQVADSSGRRAERWFIRSEAELAGQRFPLELSLADRRGLRFPMLLGRAALAGRFVVDPVRSYLVASPSRAMESA